LPSLVIPLVYCIFAGFLLSYLTFGKLFFPENFGFGLAVIFFVWQAPLVLLAIWKTRNARNRRMASQLFVLLNIYFFARGLAVFRGR
jgi:hypothetical protein